MLCYHVDRTGNLKPYQTINLFKPNIDPAIFEQTLSELYPEGISEHGSHYLIQSYDGFQRDTSTEQIFELYRKMYFPDKPTRFQSFFAFPKLEQAKQFYSQFSKFIPSTQIFKVSVEEQKYHIGDMNLLRGDTILQCHQNAIDYWSGKICPSSVLEILIVPPIKILNRLTL